MELEKCYACNDILPPRIRKRVRPRRCVLCNNKAAAERRNGDPVLYLHHKWGSNVNKHWPDADPKIRSVETVRHVWDLCEHKCVVTGTDNVKLLCIAPVESHTHKGPPTIEQLVILTTHEAQSLSRASNEKRLERFPEEVLWRLGLNKKKPKVL